jgi:bisphosphoglycerate-independent phosphoglycerate mutase (AlkP superfamily)
VRGPLVLVVIDGFGIATAGPGNAVTLANTPSLDALARDCLSVCPTGSRATRRSAT